MTNKELEKYRLTDEEMAEVQGDKEACLAIIHGFDTCSGCSANCRAVADAQLSKLLPLLEEAKREERKAIASRMNKRNVGGVNPEWALSDKDWQALQQGREGE